MESLEADRETLLTRVASAMEGEKTAVAKHAEAKKNAEKAELVLGGRAKALEVETEQLRGELEATADASQVVENPWGESLLCRL